VLNSYKKIVNVITQSMMLRYISDQIEIFPQSVLQKKIREIGAHPVWFFFFFTFEILLVEMSVNFVSTSF
jgi:L-lysine 2,3-aminomutase